METSLSPLFTQAFRRVPAREANQAIDDVRATEGARVRNFELVVAPDATAEWLQGAMLPKFVYHMESLGIRPPNYHGIFVSFFVGDELLFFHSKDVMDFVCEALKLTPDEMYDRWGTHESRVAITREPASEPEIKKDKPLLALPPGKSDKAP